MDDVFSASLERRGASTKLHEEEPTLRITPARVHNASTRSIIAQEQTYSSSLYKEVSLGVQLPMPKPSPNHTACDHCGEEVKKGRGREETGRLSYPQYHGTTYGVNLNGKTVTEIALEQNLPTYLISDALMLNDEKRYRDIMGKRRRPPFYEIPRQQIWNDLRNGVSRNETVKKYGIPRSTLSRKLQRDNETQYNVIMTPRTIVLHLPTVPPEIWDELEKGATLRQLAPRFNISAVMLGRRLRRIDANRYEAIMKQKPPRRYFGSPDAKRQGADSLFELEIRKLLQKHGVPFEERQKIKFESHRYRPDFVIRHRIILEATGFSFREYWQHYREKIGNYIALDYEVFVVVPDELYHRATEYLPIHERLTTIKYSEFKRNIREYARILKGRE